MNYEVQTPKKYVVRLLDEAGYRDDVFGRSVLENSCGNGNILVEIVRRFIDDGQRSGASGEEIREHLEKDIHAYEINPERARECESRLAETAKQYGLDRIQWDIRQEDYLRADGGEYDFIIGNPPYITYHDLSQDQRVFLRKQFDSCKEGRFDYSYAFIEKSIQSLKENGILAYLIPFSVFRNRFAKILRGMIYPGLQKMIDFRGKEVFPNISLTASIIVYGKENISPDQKSEDILRKKNEQMTVVTAQRDMAVGSLCEDEEENGITFGELFSVQNSIATLYNDAYLIDPEKEDDIYYYLRDGHAIEKTATYRAVSSRTFRKKQERIERRIIVPYKLEVGAYERYSEEEYKILFPCAYRHLKTYEKELAGRCSDGSAAWFEFGRSQALASVIGEKLIVSMVASKKYAVNFAGIDDIPYAGYFIKAVDEKNESLMKAKEILESDSFYKYIQMYGTPTTKDSVRISVREILKYPILIE